MKEYLEQYKIVPDITVDLVFALNAVRNCDFDQILKLGEVSSWIINVHINNCKLTRF